MDVYTQFELGQTVEKDGKPYIVVGTAGINAYLVVEKDADPKKLAVVMLLQVPWIGNTNEKEERGEL